MHGNHLIIPFHWTGSHVTLGLGNRIQFNSIQFNSTGDCKGVERSADCSWSTLFNSIHRFHHLITPCDAIDNQIWLESSFTAMHNTTILNWNRGTFHESVCNHIYMKLERLAFNNQCSDCSVRLNVNRREISYEFHWKLTDASPLLNWLNSITIADRPARFVYATWYNPARVNDNKKKRQIPMKRKEEPIRWKEKNYPQRPFDSLRRNFFYKYQIYMFMSKQQPAPLTPLSQWVNQWGNCCQLIGPSPSTGLTAVWKRGLNVFERREKKIRRGFFNPLLRGVEPG